MRIDRRLLAAALAPGAALLAWILLGCAAFWFTLTPEQRQASRVLGPILETRGIVVVLWWLLGAWLAGSVARRLYEAHVAMPARLAERAEALVADPGTPLLGTQRGATAQRLAGAVDALATQRRALGEDIARHVAEASQRVEQERNRLAALMAELTQSVVVCNRDGRILLYNDSARALFRAMSPQPQAIGGAQAIGLGRSIYTLFDRALVAHALDTLEQRIVRAVAGTPGPSAQFVTTGASGRLVQVQMAPVRAPQTGHETAGSRAGAAGLTGFVLMLDDISERFDEQSTRDRQLMSLVEGSRASLASMRAALDMLEYPDLEPALRERFQQVIHDEVAKMSDRLDAAARSGSGDLAPHWPLQDMLGTDLASAAARRIEAGFGIPVDTSDIDPSLWLKVDSYSLVQALVYLAGCLVDQFGLRVLQLRLARADARAHLDLVWSGHPASTETLMGWQIDPMQMGNHRLSLSVRDVIERHGGEVWIERERARHQTFFRFLVPVAPDPQTVPEPAPTLDEGRPEFYDFDLFRATDSGRALEDRPLAELTYTVFDTETTGLDPSGGDRIIQIGAVRIVNGRLLRGERFDQLVDPQRPISAASIPIHGISQEMVRGQPAIEQVLPVFHAFARDTVLVGHNAAFDMRFLELAEASAGTHFDQPVLDTLLLAEAVHPHQSSHRLEAIAERLGVQVAGRHTAIGDAVVTAEVFLRLLGLLRQRGIVTLGQALEASRKSYYARVSY